MRRRKAVKRRIMPDPIFGDVMVAKFINNLMRRGKKGLAERTFYSSLDIIKQRTKKDGLEIFRKAVENVAPVVEVRSKRVGGATYQVPIEVRHDRRQALAHRWIIQYAHSRSGKTMSDRLAAELIAAAGGDGGAVKKREETHRMADANKAFAHFR
ncbi:MAG: 30S ribosomal protein S7 [Candidatus Marinimicrobia bacterium]|nr:30S ribosomal protein S7 [Candidatus Neomarinimicrobiota bacterium]MCF7902641.1 30S ribosomal protein S7 [Candidatus Neomarinimicrobiota bacterium]